jgi:hypothetical protein
VNLCKSALSDCQGRRQQQLDDEEAARAEIEKQANEQRIARLEAEKKERERIAQEERTKIEAGRTNAKSSDEEELNALLKGRSIQAVRDRYPILKRREEEDLAEDGFVSLSLKKELLEAKKILEKHLHLLKALRDRGVIACREFSAILLIPRPKRR